ncbi:MULTISPECIES: benzaldehyde dehydrogenase [unclassified Microbulbifer]|uniref:benzaldehyde dehydrogenase n=1 Tax=unclassified Microbulbifer TaxID=2619833 RepID=UPI0027E460C8|nr:MULTISPECIES: benzaldehyde dehydrogenase [unclassified Microbulbifer]
MSLSASDKLLSDSRWQGRLFNGSWFPSQGGVCEVVEPGTGETLSRVGFANAADVATACAGAAAAQAEWARLGARERAELFRKAANILQQDFDELSVYVARETGGIIPKGQHEVREAIAILHHAAALAQQSCGEMLQSPPGRLSLARRVPRGVVGIISPFNFPLVLSMRAVAPALACGNTVVLKPDPQTPVSGGFMIARAFEEAGLPEGVLHVLPGAAEAGEALCTDRHVQMIQFTGSTAVGRRVGELAGKHLKKVSLELGGNNALIILDDADLDVAVNNAAWGAFLHQGQICMAASRIFVQEPIREAFIRELAEKAAQLPVGNPAAGQVALGPVINDKQLQRVKLIIADSVAAGARIEAGGEHEGLFHQATVLSGVKPGMRAFDEECFGPVTGVIGFDTDEEALQLANRHEGSLAAAVISASVGRAMRIADQLKSGLVHVNDQTVNDDANNPFGAPGVAGAGSSVGGPADIDEYTRWQWLTIRDTPPQYPF